MFQTSAEQARADGRLERKFWAINDENDIYRVVHVSGFSTPNDGYWWVPELGYSMSEGNHLFIARWDAVAKAVRLIDLKMEKLVASRADLLAAASRSATSTDSKE